MIIKEKDFILRPINLDDSQGYWECMQNPETIKMFMSIPHSLEESNEEIKDHMNKIKKEITEVFTILVNNNYAGNVKLDYQNWDINSKEGRLHLWIHPNYRGKGLATKALITLIKHGFEDKKMKIIYAQCKKINKNVCKVLEKSGLDLVEERFIENTEKLWWQIKNPELK